MTEPFRQSDENPSGPQHPQALSAPSAPSAPQQPGYPPQPAFEPAPAGPVHSGRRRARGPVALLAAVALAAAAVGGGTAYAFQTLTGDDSGSSGTRNVNGTSVSAGSKGTVAGVAAAVSPSIVEINATTGSGKSTGSGVIITSDGEIVTNNHVISGATDITVRTSDGKTYKARTVGTDSKKDLALIKLEGASGLKAANLGDSDDVQVGQEVVAIGSPEGLTGTVTSGIVSALDRDVTVSADPGRGQDQNQGQGPGGGWPFEFGGEQFNGDTGSSKTTYKAMQTDASLNPGNSGGALIDMDGNIIGINSAMYSAGSGSGAGGGSESGSVGLGFAIPINTVKADLGKLRAGASG
ncbi:S1C family serine protease [Streptomyces flavofungini]|uniref:S1C family serine protease n=1 Tax=Streptomyces flavofungini TaxID=68200 RepID=UPI0025AFD174|nr:trypsin-like peptidase domain-containing protein [Streptomyces flavofungini]WJV47829.1 trypsin-like peptidase domain-containing protein [Streptomyces flavofungini]